MAPLSTTDELDAFCSALARQPFVAVDTEFLRESTYWPKLCLIQAAAPGVEGVIDPLAPGMDLAPFLQLMNDQAILKVFHAARQDIEIFHRLTGQAPTPLFDTQIGAMACGHGDSIAYDALVQSILRRRVDKSSRFTDWSRRPLSQAQLDYALADVVHLRDLYPKMAAELEAKGRSHWLDDEHASLLDPGNYDVTPQNAWRRLKVRKTHREYLIALQTAAAWRERQAQSRDQPRARILKDEALFEIAEQRPRTPAAFDRLRITPKGFGASKLGQELARLMAEALDDPDLKPEQPVAQPSAGGGLGPTVELLKVLLRLEAEEHGVAPRLIANASDLEQIAGDDHAPVAALQGWRREVFGARALSLKHGEIALRLRQGRVEIIAPQAS